LSRSFHNPWFSLRKYLRRVFILSSALLASIHKEQNFSLNSLEM
jgi:hypothetical protein